MAQDDIYFLGKEGASGRLINLENLLKIGKFRIPTYQRPYAWNEDHFKDLLNTIIENKEQIRGAFLSAIITAKDDQPSLETHYIVIDGQQRITSLLLLLRLILEEIKKEYDNKKKELQETERTIQQQNGFDLDKYKKVVRSVDDNKEKIELLKEILSHDRIYRENGVSSEDLREDQSLQKEKSVLNCIYPESPIAKAPDIFKKILNQFQQHDISKNPIESLKYVLESCQFCLLLVQGQNAEDYAIDIFNSLNSTGEPLTAFEILKSLVHKRDKRKGGAATVLSDIEKELEKKKMKKDKQNKYTDRLLLFLNLMTEGLKQDKFSKFRDKKKVLDIIGDKKKFDKDRLKDFVGETSKLHSFILSNWESKDRTNLFQAEDAQICFDFLKNIGHDRPLPILYHFHKITTAEKENLDEVVKACSAFTGLWRGIASDGGTDRIDNKYADLIKNLSNIKTEEEISDLKKKMKDSLIERIMNKSIDDINEEDIKEKWVEKFKDIDIYKKSNLARFLIFIAFHNKYFDKDTNTKLLKGSKQYKFLRWEEWQGDDYRTIEHIVPRAHKSIGKIGNLILLPQSINSRAANKKFIEKKEIYLRCLNPEPSDELPYISILKEITSYGDTDTEEDGHLSERAIDKRGEILGLAVWDTLYQDWLK